MIKLIDSRTNPYIKYVEKLKNTSFSKEERKFLVENPHLIEMAKGHIDTILTTEKLDETIYNNQVIINEIVYQKISQNKSTRNLLAVCNFIDEKPLENRNLIYLDNVQDPGNVGTIIRSALAFNFTDLALSKDSAYKYSFKTIQSSQGAIFKTNILDGDIELLKKLKKEGYILIATTLSDKSTSLNKFNFNEISKYVIILGNEGRGISKEILSLSDIHIKIDINGIDSLNVGVAAGVIMYQAFIQSKGAPYEEN